MLLSAFYALFLTYLVLVKHRAELLGLGQPDHLLVGALLIREVAQVLVALAAGVTRGWAAWAVRLPVLAVGLEQVAAPEHGPRLRPETEMAGEQVVGRPGGADQVGQLCHHRALTRVS